MLAQLFPAEHARLSETPSAHSSMSCEQARLPGVAWYPVPLHSQENFGPAPARSRFVQDPWSHGLARQSSKVLSQLMPWLSGPQVQV